MHKFDWTYGIVFCALLTMIGASCYGVYRMSVFERTKSNRWQRLDIRRDEMGQAWHDVGGEWKPVELKYATEQ